MLEQCVIEYCAPTLAGIKTGNLFSLKTENKENAKEELKELNEMLHKKGINIVSVKESDKRILLYLYRPDFLKKELSNPEAIEILEERGYTCESVDMCLCQLRRNLANYDDFPHEIGLFLGYPPADVKCFINNPSDGVVCVGCWKAYNNKDTAEATFRKFKKCSECYMRQYKNGKTLKQLLVQARN